IDDRSHAQRFSPRKKKTYWSAVNVAKVEGLIAAGLMHASGLRVFEERDLTEKPKYSFEQTTDPELEPAMIETFKANPEAWAFFEQQSASYRKRISWWVINAKKQETQLRRLESLIAARAEGKQHT
ncbi:MAG: YdeI/OmpD-associated family protein, partial [Thermomicrobiales bacterium]